VRWKQFFTSVKAFNAVEAREFMDRSENNSFTLLDVRQPKEYESEHIPGAKLIPLGELDDRMGDIDPQKPTIVYCAIGGRSRVAAQMLAGKGFHEVYNLSGGIKAWHSEKAVGKEELGLNLFSGKESTEEMLFVAYFLEAGLREYYLSMAEKVDNEKTRLLFIKLSSIEIKHQDRIVEEYNKISNTTLTRKDFDQKLVADQMEGGLTTEEYLSLYEPDLSVPEEVISLAMAIEAQALDLYQRAADRVDAEEIKKIFIQIASEERAHITQLGKLFETL
jgi:sulfur-carrier protein adenylyltransferase/sulfurtransferase